MRRYFHPAILVMTVLTMATYSYPAWRITHSFAGRIALALPFLCVWSVPVIYWFGRRERQTWGDQVLHVMSFLSMGWLNFMLGSLLLSDLTLAIAQWWDQHWLHFFIQEHQGSIVLGTASIALMVGMGRAVGGPLLHEVTIHLPELPEDLDGLRIAQISDLHVGPTVRRSYVERVVVQTNSLTPHLIVLTGDLVDGSVEDLAPHIAPLSQLKSKHPPLLCLGNHDYYSGAEPWTKHFLSLGICVLRNEYRLLKEKESTFLVAGVTDPAAKMFAGSPLPDPEAALHQSFDHDDGKSNSDGKRPSIPQGMLRILLAHNPKIAAQGAKAGYHLQLSGHTHGGQFIPWTFVTKWVHSPHFAGLSQEGAMSVYVNSGTGTWGPPIRMGTTPELTLITLRKAKMAG